MVGRGSKLWSDIIHNVLCNSNLRNYYLNNARIVLGDGRRTLVWLDKSAGNVCFKEEFPRLFSLSTNKHGVVKSFFQRRGEAGSWKVGFRKALLIWKEQEVRRLYTLLGTVPTSCSNKPDELIWEADTSRMFTIFSAYNWCDSFLGPKLDMPGSIWNNCAPPNVQFFGWLAWQGKVKTSSFLQRVDILDGNANIVCVFCQSEVETIDHILLFCGGFGQTFYLALLMECFSGGLGVE